MMIAITITSFVAIGILMAMHVGLTALDRVDKKVLINRRVMGVERIMHEEVAGIIPVVADCRPNGGSPAGKILYFQGLPESMRFVSTYSLAEADRGRAQILVFQVIPGENQQGVRLIVNEQVYPGPLYAGAQCMGVRGDPETGQRLAQFPPLEPGPNSFVLADKLAYCRISYLEKRPEPELQRWDPAWHFNDRLPMGIRIEMAPLEPDPTRLQLLTVTEPVHINKWVLGTYVD
jgi:hypothetical protein